MATEDRTTEPCWSCGTGDYVYNAGFVCLRCGVRLDNNPEGQYKPPVLDNTKSAKTETLELLLRWERAKAKAIERLR